MYPKGPLGKGEMMLPARYHDVTYIARSSTDLIIQNNFQIELKHLRMHHSVWCTVSSTNTKTVLEIYMTLLFNS